MLECIQAFFSGRVQGVGFRWTVLDHAERFGLKGSVKNLPDGRVEVIAQGNKEAVEAFFNALKKDSGSAKITEVEMNHLEAKALKPFHIEF